MTRITTTILIVMVLMNGTVGVMAASGLSDQLGVELAPGVNDQLDKAISTAEDGFAPDSGVGQTLFALFISATRTIIAVIQAIFTAPTMFTNLGFPSWFVVPIFAPIYIISTFEIIAIATGRRTI